MGPLCTANPVMGQEDMNFPIVETSPYEVQLRYTSRSILPSFRSVNSDHLQGCALTPLAKWHDIIGRIELERGSGDLDSWWEYDFLLRV